MKEIVGIDLGTTNSLIGVMDSGFPILLADANGERLTPSVVHFPLDGAPLVGSAATRMRVLDPSEHDLLRQALDGTAQRGGEDTMISATSWSAAGVSQSS